MLNKTLIKLLLIFIVGNLHAQSVPNQKVNGYKGIWFELNQKYKNGDKYSGALSTYTAKHVPLAIYSAEVNKTFFVYGGTSAEHERHLLCMIGEFDHTSGLVKQPTIVLDKDGVDDPHDNPSLLIDNDGFIWVFVSGRGNLRPGYKFKSVHPFDISSFVEIEEKEMTYPQPWYTEQGYFHFFTKYTGTRQLFYQSSTDGIHWTEDQLIAAIPVSKGEKSGHYQVSNTCKKKTVATFFNRHPYGMPDKRTDLYYVQSNDFGEQWTTVDGKKLEIPITVQNSPSRVIDYATLSKNIYLKDLKFDKDGNPICLYIRSNGYEPGPRSLPYEWCITKWDGKSWQTHMITTSDHNYDMGSLYILEDEWLICGPTEPGAQQWGVGGEIAIWKSTDLGNTWVKSKDVTNDSKYSHSYVRRPVNYKSPFCYFWADGHSHEFSKSHLYFGDFQGNVWQLPYVMTKEYEKPLKVK